MSEQISQNESQQSAQPYFERLSHSLVRRRARVASAVPISASMIRVTLVGEELDGFVSPSAGDHIKVFLPDESGESTVMRDYTPRKYDAEKRELILDFVAHPGGPGAEWAMHAQAGDELEFGGPRGSLVIHNPSRRWLLIGDETALPSMMRRVEEASSDEYFQVLALISTEADKLPVDTNADIRLSWLTRSQRPNAEQTRATDADAVVRVLKANPPEPDTFVWLAGESDMVRQVRTFLLSELNWPKKYLRAAGYWKIGVAEGHEKFE